MRQQMTLLDKKILEIKNIGYSINGDWASGIGELGGMGGY